MKKLKLLVVLFLAAFMIPFAVYAEGEEAPATESNEVNLYFFRGEGCSHCAEAEAWFESIEEEYGSKFNIVDYEVWYNEENSKLMDKVAKARGEDVQGVPYIIVGNKSWNGFAQSMSPEILAEINSEYSKEVSQRYDIMKLLDSGKLNEKDNTGNDVIALIIILVIVGGVAFGIYKARTITK